LIEQIVNVTNIFNKHLSITETKEDTLFYQERIERAKVFLDQTITRGTKLIKRVVSDKQEQIKMIELSTSHVISELKHQHADITSSIDTLLGTYSEVVEDMPKLVDANTVIQPLKKPKKKGGLVV
jgi:hypothetical protein